MNTVKYKIYCILSVVGILLASYYPIKMGVSVISDMVQSGAVLIGNYPKYIIPYTPICFALIFGVLFMPLFVKFFKRFAVAVSSVLSLGVFAVAEFLFEHKVLISSFDFYAFSNTDSVLLERWQMFSCAFPYNFSQGYYEVRTETPIDILIGNYTPAFKLHFYLISAIIIITVLACLFGFGNVIISGNKSKLKLLIAQATTAVAFIGMCIWACFTAFYRTGDIYISPLSAVLMSVFFILMGVSVGIYVGSILIGKKRLLSVFVPAIASSVITLTMYLGEMILLHSHLYRFGTSFLFEGLPGIVLARLTYLLSWHRE